MKTDWLGAIAVIGLSLMLGVAIGAGTAGHFKNVELLELKTTYDSQIAAANKAALDADERAQGIQRTINAAILAGVTEYTQKDENEKAQDARTIAALRADVTRLRVKTNNPVCGGRLPGTATGAEGSNGQADATLAPAVAARLAGRYADYNAVVRQLDLCQAIVTTDRTQPSPN